MTDFDPFAAAPADEPNAGATPEAPASSTDRPAASTNDSEAITTTFKGGTGFDDPWVVTRAGSVAEANALLDQAMADYMAKVQKVAAKFVELGGGPKSSGGGGSQQAQRPARQAPPSGAPESPGEGWVYKTGVSAKNGKTWQAWMPPRGSDESPVFF